MLAEAEVVVRREVDDLLAVVGTDGALFVVEYPQLEEGSALLQIVELGGEMGQLGARCGGRGHGNNRKPFVYG